MQHLFKLFFAQFATVVDVKSSEALLCPLFVGVCDEGSEFVCVVRVSMCENAARIRSCSRGYVFRHHAGTREAECKETHLLFVYMYA